MALLHIHGKMESGMHLVEIEKLKLKTLLSFY